MTVKIEFFHDVVCGWCYIQSPVLRKIRKHFDVEVIHRSYILQHNPQQLAQRFGSLAKAKREILSHWHSCQKFEGSTDRFNIQGMTAATFSYPSGLLSAQATKAAEYLNGQLGHWNMFDALQKAHLQHAQNIGNIDTILAVADMLGYEIDEFLDAMYQPKIFEALKQDSARAQAFNIRSIPAMIVNGEEVIRQTTRYEAFVDYLHTLTNG